MGQSGHEGRGGEGARAVVWGRGREQLPTGVSGEAAGFDESQVRQEPGFPAALWGLLRWEGWTGQKDWAVTSSRGWGELRPRRISAIPLPPAEKIRSRTQQEGQRRGPQITHPRSRAPSGHRQVGLV